MQPLPQPYESKSIIRIIRRERASEKRKEPTPTFHHKARGSIDYIAHESRAVVATAHENTRSKTKLEQDTLSMAGRARDDTAGEGGETTTEGRRSGGGGNANASAGAAAAAKVAPFLGMLRYADRADAVLMAVGAAAAAANGMSEPLMTVMFAAVIECFGAGDDATVLHRVSKVVMYYIYLGIGTAVASFLQVSCWTVAGERQSTRLRSLYLEAVLRQDIAFFDVEMTTAEAASRMSADTVLIQDALGEKVGKYIQLVTTFVGGFIIGFVRGWMLALVVLASIPPSILSFATVSRLRAQISGKRQESYGDAGNIVEQTIGAIRTVVSFNGEKKAIAMYNNHIKRAYKATLMEGIITGLGVGCVFFVVFCSYSLAFWYGAKLIISNGYTGGQVINIVFAILTGSIAIGSIYKSGSLSLEQSIARDSPRNKGQHSFTKSIGLSGSDELNMQVITDRQEDEESGDSKAPKKAPIKRLFKLNKPEAPVLILAVIAAFVHGLMFPSFSIMMSGGIRTFYYPPHQLRKDSRFWALVCLLFAVIALISIQLEYFLFGMAGGKLIQRVRSLTFQSIVHQEVAWFDEPSNSSGALGARLYIDALNIRRLVGDNLAILVQCIVTLIAGFSIAFASDWKLTLIVICVIPVVGSQNYIQVKFLKGFSEDAKVYFALIFTAFGVSQTSGMATDSTKAQESTVSILAIIDRKPKINSISDEGIMLEKVDGNIDFRHVNFKYPSRPDVQVLSDFTLGIPARKVLSI
ncbi:hypothetical protein C2845_PM07G19770 [Panicum miliaceum]|uniref:ABC transmembrane type-1 domain-containing protein n=1 Tax=Panicum miliaceum TaxID=4540 RepID=A0A3L6SNU9_PANMI|nr:hypothetical protein C2845_PM07G19770 [Panicum miliaceum]